MLRTANGSYLYSASDLSGFLACGHLLFRNRAPDSRYLTSDGNDANLAATYGDLHEQAFLERLKSSDLRVVEQERPLPLTAETLRSACDATVKALRDGADVVYQGTLFDGSWLGFPDFLVRRAGGLSGASYDVVDTKLARSAKATALVQVALYGDLLSSVAPDLAPDDLVLALGNGTEARFQLRSAASYVRFVQQRFLGALDDAAPYPYRVEHCAVCRWQERCEERRIAEDHLSLVAGMTRQQVLRLEAAGISTLAQLATLESLPSTRIGAETAQRLRLQAHQQLESRNSGELTWSSVSPPAEGNWWSLPEPDDGDIFFDMEGFPYAEDGGVEYLFGWCDADGGFHHLFAEDRASERTAFEGFMAALDAQLDAHPGMHVYHYADYERSALCRLSNRHGVYEEAVSELLRRHVLVDLYRVVRRSLVLGADSYSIKAVEPLYGFGRSGDVKTATESLDMYQQWLESQPRDERLRAAIADYNAVDCRSTLALRNWLLEARGPLGTSFDPSAESSAAAEAKPQPAFSDWLARVETTAAALLDGVPDDPRARDHVQQGRAVLAHLLKFHQREDNAQWRDHFARQEMEPGELVADSASVGELRFERELGPVVCSKEYLYSFPLQDVGLRVGDQPDDPATNRSAGTLVEIVIPCSEDPERGALILKRGATRKAPHPAALIPAGPMNTKVLREALLRLADWVLLNGLESPLAEWRAARQLLLGAPPRLAGGSPGTDRMPLARPGEHGSQAVLRLVPLLDGAALSVQGPPGAGKTTAAVTAILDAVSRGARVAVTSNSHRVIENLLVSLVEESERRNARCRVARKPGSGGAPVPGIASLKENKDVVAALDADSVDVVGGTAWLFAREELAGRFGLLVIDEAGQVSLANALAGSGAATDVLLVGDPAQLNEPTQAQHPESTDSSALSFVIRCRATMPPDLGLFLERTRRMHPGVCAYVSDAFYEGKLAADEGLERQRVEARMDQSTLPAEEQLTGAGVRYLAVPHVGNRNSSPEEASRVREAIEELLGGTWTDAQGNTRPLTAQDILVVAPYNAQVAALRSVLPGNVAVGTVDKFQGREAPVVFYSMATSSGEDLPRDFEFLYSPNRLNVAVSRARALAVLVCNPALLAPRCRSTTQICLANALCKFVEHARHSAGS